MENKTIKQQLLDKWNNLELWPKLSVTGIGVCLLLCELLFFYYQPIRLFLITNAIAGLVLSVISLVVYFEYKNYLNY